MSDVLERIMARLEHYTQAELLALIGEFLPELDERQQRRCLALVERGPRPPAPEVMEPADPTELLAAIRALHNAIANDEYVQEGAGYDPAYGEYRGFGDDSWIDEMDGLFAAATSLFRAGQFAAAATAYRALFGIFNLTEDGFHFTRPDPAAALRTDLDMIKQNLFIAIARSDPEPVPAALAVSEELAYYGGSRYALLDAWHGHTALEAALETALVDICAATPVQERPFYRLSHAAELLRESYRRYHDLADYEALCRRIGPRHGWAYEDLVARCQQEGRWEAVLRLTGEALATLPANSRSRLPLEEARGQALLRLDRPAEALAVFRALFPRQETAPVYLALRAAALAAGQWEDVGPEVRADLRRRVLDRVRKLDRERASGYTLDVPAAASLLGFAYLLEGQWSEAVDWALQPSLQSHSYRSDLLQTVATGLLRLALVGQAGPLDEALAHQLRQPPDVIREYGDQLDPVGSGLPAEPLLDAAVQLYEQLVAVNCQGGGRPAYAQAGVYCTVIRAIRHLQGRGAQFAAYYQGLFATYSRYPALKDELRKAVEGPGYRKKR